MLKAQSHRLWAFLYGENMAKCSVVLMYETYPKATPLGITDNPRLKVLVKRQLIKEAQEALRGAEILGDDVLIASFQSSIDKLQNTLNLLIPSELEEIYLNNRNLEDEQDK
jgi:hypothetical protein